MTRFFHNVSKDLKMVLAIPSWSRISWLQAVVWSVICHKCLKSPRTSSFTNNTHSFIISDSGRRFVFFVLIFNWKAGSDQPFPLVFGNSQGVVKSWTELIGLSSLNSEYKLKHLGNTSQLYLIPLLISKLWQHIFSSLQVFW